MQTVKEWALALVVISVVSTVVLILTPSGALEKSVKTTVAIIILFLFVSPFLKSYSPEIIDLNSDVNFESTSYDSKGYLIFGFRDEINRNITELLNREGIANVDVETYIEINNEDEISIESVRICIPREYGDKKEIACNIIKNELGIIVEAEVVD